MSKAAKRERQRQNRDARREFEEQLQKRRRRTRSIRGFAFLAAPVIIVGAILAISNSGGDGNSKKAATGPYATLTTSLGDIVVQLDKAEAPKSEAQFVKLADKGFYNGLKFHRASSTNGIIQSGDPKGDGTGGSGTKVPDELPKTAYKLGDFAFANSGPNTSDSQFFIVTGDAGTKLPKNYNRFGHVVAGLDVAQKIQALAPTSGDGAPTTPVDLVSVKISKQNPVTATTTTAASTTTGAAETTTSSTP